MNTESLQVFVDVVRFGSFSQVARHREIAPSSISRVISTLEKELGARLFQRNTRQLSLTEAGNIYYQRVESIVEELNLAQQAIQDSSRQTQGPIRLTASPSFGITCIAPRLSALHRQHPELRVELLLSDKKNDLFAERIDLAIRQGHLTDSNLVAERFLTSYYRVCASPQYLKEKGMPKSPNDLGQHTCLTFPFSGFEQKWNFRKKPKGQEQPANVQETQSVAIDSPIVINNGLALKQCAIDDAGIVLLSNWLVDDAIEDGRLKDIFPSFQVSATDFSDKISFVYPSRSYVPEKVRSVMNFLRTSFD